MKSITIPPYPEIATEMKIDSLMDVGIEIDWITY